jgi:DNA polymerase-1
MDLAAVETLFNELEFRTLIRRLHSLARPSDMSREKQQLSLFGEEVARVGFASDYETTVHLVNDLEGLKKLQEKLTGTPRISLDTETTSVEPMRAKLVGISLATQAGEGYYIPTGHQTGDPQLPEELVIDALRPFLTNGDTEIIGHNLKYDGLVLTRCGLKPASYEFDTMIAEWLVEPSSRRLGLKDVADRYLRVNMTRIEDLIGTGKNQLNMADVPVEKVAPYAAADADIPLQLQSILQNRLEDHNALDLFKDVEMPLVPILADMEEVGISLDVPFFQQMSAELQELSAEIKEKVFKSIGYEFNLNSTQQLSKALFESLKLDPPDRRKKTASGFYSTSAAVLEQMRGNHPVVDRILEYREYTKLKSTYVDALPQQINQETKRVHTSFNQTGSVTGRLASSNPNLQNIPIRTELGQRVRRGFIAEGTDSVLLTVDYSQIELRIVASMSNDKAMLSAFLEGQDIHTATASAVFDIPIDQVNKEHRRQAKAINFGLIYGMSAFGLSHTTGLTLAESEDFVQAYFEQFPG